MAKGTTNNTNDTNDTDQILEGLPVEDELPWVMGMWGTFTQWQCTLCRWDTLEGEAAILEHYLAVHAPPKAPDRPGVVLRADRFGNEIKE